MPGSTSWRQACWGEYSGRYSIRKGHGPTRLMSPKTHSTDRAARPGCWSADKVVVRSASGSKPPDGPRASVMLGNFTILKGLPCTPGRRAEISASPNQYGARYADCLQERHRCKGVAAKRRGRRINATHHRAARPSRRSSRECADRNPASVAAGTPHRALPCREWATRRARSPAPSRSVPV